jgi:hypothetical protein
MVMSQEPTLGIGHDTIRWSWPFALRAAHESGDEEAEGEFLALLEPFPPGHLPPVLRAEQYLARARIAAREGEPAAAGLFESATAALRDARTPFHLAHGLLDHAAFLRRHGRSDEAEVLVDEAGSIGRGLRAEPLVARATAVLNQDVLA